jgi:alginate O-acetyltransferase complex protein AlgI
VRRRGAPTAGKEAAVVFSSLLFLVGFLPVFLVLYYAAPVRFRNHVALVASYAFYAWGAPRFVFVLFLSSAADYLLSRLLHQTAPDWASRRRRLLITSLVLNLGLLAYFKYVDFFVEEVGELVVLLGGGRIGWWEVFLPIGISFFTFQKITYIVDVYRGTVRPARSFATYALYVAMFPQLIAGPIIRYHDLAQQLERRTHSVEMLFSGIWRFCLGLGKKVLVANTLGEVADGAFKLVELNSGPLPTTLAWAGILCYTFQIYFDFSGYSDMAIGLGRMMGFRFLENFNSPYIAASFTEFWRDAAGIGRSSTSGPCFCCPGSGTAPAGPTWPGGPITDCS